MRRTLALILLALPLFLAACQSPQPAPPSLAPLNAAPLTPAPAGTTAPPAGAPAVPDEFYRSQAQKRATIASIGQEITWNNPASGASGKILPLRDFYSNTGAYCREFRETASSGAKQRAAHTSACQQPGGAWQTLQ
jgi:hypothetical protein